MSVVVPTYTLNSGAKIPQLGFGNLRVDIGKITGF
jgi:hypothetical protein